MDCCCGCLLVSLFGHGSSIVALRSCVYCSPCIVIVEQHELAATPLPLHPPCQVAHENEVELEGACEGSLACSTCHVIVEDQVRRRRGWGLGGNGCTCVTWYRSVAASVRPAAAHTYPLTPPPPPLHPKQEYYDKLPEPDDDENDMLDLAFGLTDT